jgi:hypothetical protein
MKKAVWAVVLVICIALLLVPSGFSSLVWGPINLIIHGLAILVFVLVTIVSARLSIYFIPIVAVFLSFMPYFDWLQHSDSIRGAHWPRLDMIEAQWEWHLIMTAWALILLFLLRLALRKLQNIDR